MKSSVFPSSFDLISQAIMGNYSYIVQGNPLHPQILLLHGLFGCKEDWKPVMDILSSQYYCLAIDLPGHGHTAYQKEIINTLRKHLTPIDPKPLVIGYSMGARIALQIRDLSQAIVVIGGHLGLKTEEEKHSQHTMEMAWKEKLLTLPLESFFRAWYAQPLFASLAKKPLLVEQLIKKRATQDPILLVQVMNQLSLSHQPLIDSFPTPTLLVYGEKDSKYQQLYHTIQLPKRCVKNAGHACLVENPQECGFTILHSLQSLLCKQ